MCVCVRVREGGHRIRDWFRVLGPLNNASSPAAGGLNWSRERERERFVIDRVLHPVEED